MKKILLGSFIGIALLLLMQPQWARYSGSQAARELATAFVEEVASGDFSSAHAMLASEFSADTSAAGLALVFQQRGLASGVQAHWRKGRNDGMFFRLRGRLENPDGRSVPLEMHLIEEGEQWRIFSLRLPLPGLRSSESELLLPDRRGMVTLLHGLVGRLSAALDTGDYSSFYTALSPVWRRSTTEAELQQQFSALANSELDFWSLVEIPPIFDPAPQVERGELVQQGYFASSPERLHFRVRYALGHLGWQPTAMTLELK